MSAFLRRRLGRRAESSPVTSTLARNGEGNVDDAPRAEKVRLAPISKILTDGPKYRRRQRTTTFIFALGGLFGLVLAGLFAKHNDLIDFPELGELRMDSLLDVLPAAFIRDANDLAKGERDAVNYDAFRVGLKLREEGISAKHPVIMIPGVISTGLESWGTAEKSRFYFRKRLWGSWSMMRALVTDKENWKKHIMLDKETGMDPPGVKLRAAQGFNAADFFITGYWIWNKIVENLASIGYDTANSFIAAYDWRLSYANLETRDHYFTRLKYYVEMGHDTSGEKVVLTSHSMGGQVLFYFFHWVASPLGGNAGDDWVEKHVEAWINISGCLLGTAKGLPAVLSGEMKDTAQLNAFAVYGLEKFLSREERAEIFRAMPGISSMLPIGGDRVWGNSTWAPDDPPAPLQNVSVETGPSTLQNSAVSYGQFLSFKWHNSSSTSAYTNSSVQDSMNYLINNTEPWYHRMLSSSYSTGIADDSETIEANEHDPRKWINPLETRLPLAPSLKIYCFYGINKPTERAYYYRRQHFASSSSSSASNASSPSTSTSRMNITIDTALTSSALGIDHGVIMAEGDGTVNLLSVGYMCNHGWRGAMPRYNPANVSVTVWEMPHEPERFSPRGGPNTGDHVDILGRQTLNEAVLKVAAGRGHELRESVESRIKEYAERVKIVDEGEERWWEGPQAPEVAPQSEGEAHLVV